MSGLSAGDRWLDRLRPIAGLLVDGVLIAGMLGYAVGYLLVIGDAGISSTIGMLAALAGAGGCLVLSRRRPIVALVITAALYFALAHTLDPSDNGPDVADGIFVVIALMIYRLAARTPAIVSALTVAAFAGALQLIDVILAKGDVTFNPFLIVGTAGPWIIGLIVRSRTRAQEDLYARQRDLEDEQARYARESVRYERARIARELHDIVAHNVSIMVVQASAGHYLAAQDPGLALATFDQIAEFAHQAETEIGRLIALLDDSSAATPTVDLTTIAELVRRAHSTGLAVTYRGAAAASDRLDPATAQIAYRIVQEALTNALKHAPGAPVTVTISGTETQLDVLVTNAPVPIGVTPSPRLGSIGGGRGIDGLRQRVHAAGGTLQAGPASDGGWEVHAQLTASV